MKLTNYIRKIYLFIYLTLIGVICSQLSIDSLPSPMRPRAYFSSDWNISSNWYEWEYEN